MAQLRTEVFETPVGHCIRLTVSTGVVGVAIVLSPEDAASLTGLLADAAQESAARDAIQKTTLEAAKNGAGPDTPPGPDSLPGEPPADVNAGDRPKLTLVGREKDRGH